MSAEEFRVALARLNISNAELARRLKLSSATISNYARGAYKVPYPVQLVIEQMLRDSAKPEEVAM